MLGPLLNCAGAPSRLEHHQLIRAQAKGDPTWNSTRKGGREFVADHILGVGRIVQTQRDPQIGIRSDVVIDHTGRPLRRKEQMDPEAATTLGHPDQRREKIGQLLCERGKLVDHDNQARQGLHILRHSIFSKVVGSNGTNEPLAANQLSLEADQGAFGEAIVQVGDDPNRVGEIGTDIERRATLVIDKHEGQMIGTEPGGEAHHESSQQFTLAGTSRTGDEPMRAVTNQVDVDEAIRRQTDRRARRRVETIRSPPVSDRCGRALIVGKHIGQLHTSRNAGAALIRVLRVDECGQRPRRFFSGALIEPGNPDVGRLIRSGNLPRPVRPSRRTERQDSLTNRWNGGICRHDHETHRRRGCQVSTERTRPKGQHRRVIHNDEYGPSICLTNRFKQPLNRAGVVRTSDELVSRTTPSMGKPPGPVPSIRFGRDHYQTPICRAAGDRRLHDDRACQGAARVEVTMQGDSISRSQGEWGDDSGKLFALLDGNQQLRQERPPIRGRQWHLPPARSDPNRCHQWPVVVDAALPDSTG